MTVAPPVRPSVPMPLWRRARVLARRSLWAALQAVPPRVVDAVHARWIAPDGDTYPVWRPLAAVLYYRPLTHDTITVPGGRGERLAVVGSRLERVLWWYGERGYEAAEAGWWRALCAQATDVLEVGANVGYYSVVGAAACAGRRYTAVEANPDAAAIARRNLDLNELGHAELVAAAAVGADGPAEIDLALPDQEAHQTAPTGSFLPGAEAVGTRTATHTMRVPTTPAGPLFAGRDLVKLDIEGSEADVLEAAMPEIRRSRPILLVEVLHGATRLQGVVRDLTAEGYRLHALGTDLRPLSLDDLDAPGYRDVLLVPAERELPR